MRFEIMATQTTIEDNNFADAVKTNKHIHETYEPYKLDSLLITLSEKQTEFCSTFGFFLLYLFILPGARPNFCSLFLKKF